MSRFVTAAAAATLALFGMVMSAHAATSTNNAPGGLSFSGTQVTRSDRKTAQTSITAIGNITTPYVDIHIVDNNNAAPQNAIDCVVDTAGGYVQRYAYEIGGPAGEVDRGIFVLTPDYCYYTNSGKSSSFTPSNATFVFQWQNADTQGDWFAQAANAYLMLPNGLCTYNGFSGIGTVNAHP